MEVSEWLIIALTWIPGGLAVALVIHQLEPEVSNKGLVVVTFLGWLWVPITFGAGVALCLAGGLVHLGLKMLPGFHVS